MFNFMSCAKGGFTVAAAVVLGVYGQFTFHGDTDVDVSDEVVVPSSIIADQRSEFEEKVQTATEAAAELKARTETEAEAQASAAVETAVDVVAGLEAQAENPPELPPAPGPCHCEVEAAGVGSDARAEASASVGGSLEGIVEASIPDLNLHGASNGAVEGDAEVHIGANGGSVQSTVEGGAEAATETTTTLSLW